MSSYNHIFDQNATKLHFLYTTKLVGYEYVKKSIEKIPQNFLEEKKTHFFGVGAPTPIFEPYISSYNYIFGQNVTKLHLGDFFNIFFYIFISHYFIWIQKVQFCEILIKNVVVRADIRLKN